MNPLDDAITIYFSKDRPMQLDFALSTNQKYSTDWEKQEEVVLYSASDERFLKAYEKVQKDHGSVSFIKEEDFKKDLLQIVGKKKYVMFVVDDCVFVRPYSLKSIINQLDNFSEAVGFSLRLGKNTTYCYPLSVNNTIPEFIDVGTKGMMAFNWINPDIIGDFGYPLEVSSSVFRVQNIRVILESCRYTNPNTLEYLMSMNLRIYIQKLPYSLCYKTSVAFCNPINKVKIGNTNRSGEKKKYTIESLLEKYEKGYIISVEEIDNYVPKGCHEEVDIRFIRGG